MIAASQARIGEVPRAGRPGIPAAARPGEELTGVSPGLVREAGGELAGALMLELGEEVAATRD
jgi:hypothetical protein